MRHPIIYMLILLLLLGHVPVDAQSNTLGLSDVDGAAGSFILTITVRR